VEGVIVDTETFTTAQLLSVKVGIAQEAVDDLVGVAGRTIYDGSLQIYTKAGEHIEIKNLRILDDEVAFIVEALDSHRREKLLGTRNKLIKLNNILDTGSSIDD